MKKQDKESWLWPKIDSLEKAEKIAPEIGAPFALECISMVIFLVYGFATGKDLFMQEPFGWNYIVVYVAFLALSAFLVRRAAKKPGMILAITGMILIFVETATKIPMVQTVNPWVFLVNFIAIVSTVRGFRGLLAVRSFKKKQLLPTN